MHLRRGLEVHVWEASLEEGWVNPEMNGLILESEGRAGKRWVCRGTWGLGLVVGRVRSMTIENGASLILLQGFF
jgi:hypothetical protein